MFKFVSIAACISVLALTATSQTLSRAEIATSDPATLREHLGSQGYDVLHGGGSEYAVELVVGAEEYAALITAGYSITLQETGRPYAQIQAEAQAAFDGVPPAGYLDYTLIVAEMAAAAAAFPAICQLVDLTATLGTPTTFEGRHMMAIKISDNVATDEDEPAILVVSAHHARELVTPVIALEAISRFTTQYGVDPEITAAVDGHEIWIAPVWNPDGYSHVFADDNLWRKNRRVFATGIGVDQNRNYPFGWSFPCSGSTTVNSGNYKGPAPESEAETITMLAWTEAVRFSKVLDFHSSGRETLWAYCSATHAFDDFLRAEAIELSNLAGYMGEERPPSADGEHYETQLARGAHAFLIETHTSFQPDFASAQAEAAQVFPAILGLIQRPVSLDGHVTDASTGLPVAASFEVLEAPFLNGETRSTDGPQARFDLVLPTGSFTVEFSAPGFAKQSVAVAATDTSTMTVTVALVPNPDTGQPNTGLAALEIPGAIDHNGVSAAFDVNGPFFVELLPMDLLELQFSGTPDQAFILLFGPLNRNLLVFGGVGSLDIGALAGMGTPTGIDVLTNGAAPVGFLDFVSRLNSEGEQLFSFSVPQLPPGIVGALQTVVLQPGGPPVLTAATQLTIL